MAIPIYDNYYHGYRKTYTRTSTEGRANAKCIISNLMRRGWAFGAVCGLLGNAQAESALNPNRPEETGYKVNGTKYPSADWYPSNYAHGVKRGKYGFGLLQWTPWKENYADNRNYAKDGDGFGHPSIGYWFQQKGYGAGKANDSNPMGNLIRQCEYIDTVPWGYYVYKRWKDSGFYYNYNWSQFKQITDPELAGKAFLFNYERPGSISGKDATVDTVRTICNKRSSNARWYYDEYASEFGGQTPTPPDPPDEPDPPTPPDPPPTPPEPEQDPDVPTPGAENEDKNFFLLYYTCGLLD